MRVFDFDGTIYDGESLFDLYLFSARYDPRVFRYIAPVAHYGLRYKLGRATLAQMESGVGDVATKYLDRLSRSRRLERLLGGNMTDGNMIDTDIIGGNSAGSNNLEALVNAFWDRRMKRIKPWYEPREDDVIVTASFDVTVGEACRRLGLSNLIASEVDMASHKVTYLNFDANKPRKFREIYGDAHIDEFYTDSKFDQPMIDMAERAFMVKGDTVTRIK